MKYIVILTALLAVACDYQSIHRLPPGGGADDGQGKVCAPNDGTGEPPVTFVQLKAEVLGPKCLRCHSAAAPRGGVNLEDYTSARRWATAMQSATANNIMPPNPAPPLEQAEKQLINQWIADGTPEALADNCDETGTDPVPAPPTEPEPPGELIEVPADEDIRFALIKTRILQNKCLSCHSDAGGNRGGLNLEIHENVSDEVDDVLFQTELGWMPPAPRPGLTAVEIQTIKRWAELGTPL